MEENRSLGFAPEGIRENNSCRGGMEEVNVRDDVCRCGKQDDALYL